MDVNSDGDNIVRNINISANTPCVGKEAQNYEIKGNKPNYCIYRSDRNK
jgi:hypothetical protein